MAVGMENPTGSPVKAKVQSKANASAAIDPLAVMRIKDLVLREKRSWKGFGGFTEVHSMGSRLNSVSTAPDGDDARLDWKLCANGSLLHQKVRR